MNAFKEVFNTEGEMQNVARASNLAKQDATGYEAVRLSACHYTSSTIASSSRTSWKVCSTSQRQTRILHPSRGGVLVSRQVL